MNLDEWKSLYVPADLREGTRIVSCSAALPGWRGFWKPDDGRAWSTPVAVWAVVETLEEHEDALLTWVRPMFDSGPDACGLVFADNWEGFYGLFGPNEADPTEKS